MVQRIVWTAVYAGLCAAAIYSHLNGPSDGSFPAAAHEEDASVHVLGGRWAAGAASTAATPDA